MKRVLNSIAAAVAVVLSAGLPVANAQQAELPASAAEGGRLWFVELSGNPVADGSSLAAVRAEKAEFRRAAAAAGIRFTERRTFDTLFNGFSVELNPRDRAKVSQLPGVKAMYPVEIIHAPSVERTNGGAAPDLASAIAMTGASVAQTTLGLSGAGVKVAVMDTGIDIDHPDLGGGGVNGSTPFPSARVTHGYDFVGDAYNADPSSASYNPVPSPGARPDDCGGHGTHVAGIVGANGQVKGVAPGVTFGAYRVFGCQGSTEADIMLAAMERALADGMHVLNMSIGSSFQWPQYPTAQASDRLVNKGMVVVASIGNSGTSGLYAAGAPGVGKKVIGVASYDNSHVFLPYFAVNGQNIGYATMTFSPPPPTSGSSVIVDVGLACNPLTPSSLIGKTALAARGTCAFATKAVNAINAGADAVVISNNAAGVLNGTLGAALANPKPVVGISLADGNFIRAQTAPVTINWTNLQASFVNPTGNLISSFSSYGLAADLSLKPNIGAPGGLILSTYPLELGAYATISGTSMASPHVAGGAALMLEAHPRTSANAMRSRLQNAADPKAWGGNPGLGFLDNVHRQGAGMLDIPGSVLATTTVEPGELALGESQAGPAVRTLTIRNSGASSVTYDLGHVGALSTGPNTFTVAATTGFASVAFSAASVVVPANGSASVDVTLIANAALAERSLYGGYVTLTPQGGGSVMRVPYAGLKGDYQSFRVLTSGGSGFPWLAQQVGAFFENRPTGATYTLVGIDIPQFLLHLDHQSRRVRLEANDAVTGKSWHRVSDDEYVARNSTATGFFAFGWDGSTFAGKGKNGSQWSSAPNGTYTVTVSVLKALGDESNPAHWETWTSPVITIARP